MQITVFAKRGQTKEGKVFFRYLATLVNRNGDKRPVQVKFRDAAGAPRPESCPMNIVFEKTDANMQEREYTVPESGEIRTSFTLWVTRWSEGAPYVDTSLDDYD